MWFPMGSSTKNRPPGGVQTLTFGRFWTHSYEHVSLPSILQSLTLRHLGFLRRNFCLEKSAKLIFKLVHLTSLTLQTEKLRWHCFDVFLHGEISALLAKYELFWKDAKTPGNAWDGGVAISVFVAPNSSCCNPLTWKMINSVMQKYQGDKKTHYRWWF